LTETELRVNNGIHTVIIYVDVTCAKVWSMRLVVCY